MTSGHRSPALPRAHPVADLPLEDLLARGEELTRRWAIALIAAREMADLAVLPLERLTQDGPGLCEGLLCALASEEGLERLLHDESAAALVGLIGGGGAAETVRGVEALRGALWELLLDSAALGYGEGAQRRVGAVADRLAHVCATLAARALTGLAARPPVVSGTSAHVAPVAPVVTTPSARRGTALPGVSIVDERGGEDPPHEPQRTQPGVMATRGLPGAEESRGPQRTPPGVGVGLELPGAEESQGAQRTPPGVMATREPPGAEESRELPGAEESREPEPAVPGGRFSGLEQLGAAHRIVADVRAAGLRAPGAPEPRIEIRDERREEGPAAWIGSIGRQLERFAQDRLPFAVLLVEHVDAGGGLGLRGVDALVRPPGRLERLLAQELESSSGGTLTRERPGRYWLVSPRTDRIGAQRLSERLRRAVSDAGGQLGAGVSILVGSAVCPEDGQRAAVLAAQADVGLYAARAESRAACGEEPRVQEREPPL